ncbi:hypothetical protein ACFT1A_15535 [Rhodococcus sp. NPDC057135]|uniref:hypothetical protein n=1 Tax=Rhodococcus sp. NPDC057135 TaxID=3346028 RepID=UPI00362DB450
MANEFGVTAWGRAWLRTVERTAASGPNPSLPTARTLARNGSVEFTAVSSGTVVAEVSTKAKTSSVTIGVPLWTKSEIAAVKSLLRSAGKANRSVCTGELPDSVVTELQARNIAVAVDLSECTASCNCSGRRSPCVHHLAAIYALAGRIDEEPVLAVTLRSAPDKAGKKSASTQSPEWIPLSDIDIRSFYGD